MKFRQNLVSAQIGTKIAKKDDEKQREALAQEGRARVEIENKSAMEFQRVFFVYLFF